MGKWANGPMGKWANGPMGQWANGQMGKWVNGQMGKCANGSMGQWANGPMGKWANGQMGKWANFWHCPPPGAAPHRIFKNEDLNLLILILMLLHYNHVFFKIILKNCKHKRNLCCHLPPQNFNVAET
jgi:hypothetical protein